MKYPTFLFYFLNILTRFYLTPCLRNKWRRQSVSHTWYLVLCLQAFWLALFSVSWYNQLYTPAPRLFELDNFEAPPFSIWNPLALDLTLLFFSHLSLVIKSCAILNPPLLRADFVAGINAFISYLDNTRFLHSKSHFQGNALLTNQPYCSQHYMKKYNVYHKVPISC